MPGDERIDTAAAAAAGPQADPGEGQGLREAGVFQRGPGGGVPGEATEQTAPGPRERREDTESETSETEGARYVERTQAVAEAEQAEDAHVPADGQDDRGL